MLAEQMFASRLKEAGAGWRSERNLWNDPVEWIQESQIFYKAAF
jgi:hypothetical protein